MSAFRNSGRSETPKSAIYKVRFRPGAVINFSATIDEPLGDYARRRMRGRGITPINNVTFGVFSIVFDRSIKYRCTVAGIPVSCSYILVGRIDSDVGSIGISTQVPSAKISVVITFRFPVNIER